MQALLESDWVVQGGGSARWAAAAQRTIVAQLLLYFGKVRSANDANCDNLKKNAAVVLHID